MQIMADHVYTLRSTVAFSALLSCHCISHAVHISVHNAHTFAASQGEVMQEQKLAQAKSVNQSVNFRGKEVLRSCFMQCRGGSGGGLGQM